MSAIADLLNLVHRSCENPVQQCEHCRVIRAAVTELLGEHSCALCGVAVYERTQYHDPSCVLVPVYRHYGEWNDPDLVVEALMGDCDCDPHRLVCRRCDPCATD